MADVRVYLDGGATPGRCGAVLASYYERYKQEKAHTRIPGM
jgi:hypothetical protein